MASHLSEEPTARPTITQRPAVLAAVVIAIIGLGIVLRCHGIGYSFDHDEVFSVEVAVQPFGRMIDAALRDRSHPPFHYVLLWAWVHVVGAAEAKVRLLSILLSLGFLSVLWRLSLRVVSRWISVLPLFLCAVSPFFVFYGEQARPYALAQLFATLTLFFFVRALDDPSSWRWPIAYGVSCLGLVYTQYMGVLLIAGQLAAALLAPRDLRIRLIAAGALGAVGVGPWAIVAAFQRAHEALPWVPGWIGKPSRIGLVDAYVAFFGTFPTRGTTRILLLVSVGALAYLVAHWRTLLTRRMAMLMASAIVPLATAFLMSRYGPLSIWAERHLIGSAVAVMCLVAVAVGRSPKWTAWPLAMGFAGWTLLAVPSSFPLHSKPPYRALAAELSWLEGALVGTEEWVVVPLEYYSPRGVRYLSDPQVRLEPTMTLVCRPVNCDEIAQLAPEYDAVLLRSLTWTPAPDRSSTLDVYLLSKREADTWPPPGGSREHGSN